MRYLGIVILIAIGVPSVANKSYTDYPQLRRFFPFGVYIAAERIADWTNPGSPTHFGRPMIEPYRRDLEDMSRHYINLVAIENTACIPVPIMKQMLAEGQRVGIFTWASENALPPDSEADAYAKSRISQFRTEKGLLVWSPWDEPYPENMEKWLLWKKAFETADPNHPVIAVTCGGPKGFENYDVIQASDYYPIYVDNPDPWSVRPFVRRYIEATTKPNWFVVQAFQGEGRRLPTVAESRMMTYMALAEGVKGILYFIYDHLVTHYNYPVTPQWEDIGKLGRILRAVGPELLDTQVDHESTLVKFEVEPNSDTRRPSDWPSGICSVLRSPQGYAFVIVYNTSTESPVKVMLRSSLPHKISDLQFLVETNRDPTADHSIELTLKPGDGRIFLLDDGTHYKRIISRVRSNLYMTERQILQAERDLAVRWDIKTASLDSLIARSGRALEHGDSRKAVDLILESKSSLSKAECAHPDFASARRALEVARESLWEYDCALSKLRRDQPEQWSDSMKWALDGFISRFLELDHEFRQGSRSVKERAEKLVADILKESRQLHSSSNEYTTNDAIAALRR